MVSVKAYPIEIIVDIKIEIIYRIDNAWFHRYVFGLGYLRYGDEAEGYSGIDENRGVLKEAGIRQNWSGYKTLIRGKSYGRKSKKTQLAGLQATLNRKILFDSAYSRRFPLFQADRGERGGRRWDWRCCLLAYRREIFE